MARHWMPAALAPIPGLALVAVLSACGEDAAADAAPVTVRFEATVKSCQPSCFKRNWSVPEQLECDDHRPDDCCADY